MRISIQFLADTASFETNTKRASKEAQRAAREMEQHFRRAGVVIGTALAAAATAVGALVAKSIKHAGDLNEMAQKVGSSAKELSTLQFAAQQSGVAIDALQTGMVKLSKNAADVAKNGVGPAADAFAALGISVKDQEGALKNSDVLLKDVAEQLSQYEDGANKTALAVAIFGKAGADMIPMLNEGREGIADLQDQARELGLELSNETAARAEEFGDKVEALGLLSRGLGNAIMEKVLPSLSGFAGAMLDTATEGDKFTAVAEGIQTGLDFMLTLFIKGTEIIQNFVAVIGFLIEALVAMPKAVLEAVKSLGPFFEGMGAILDGDLTGAAEKFREAMAKAAAVGPNFVAAFQNAGTALKGSFAANAEEAQRKLDAMAESSLNAAAGAEEVDRQTKGAAPGLRDLAGEAAKAEKAMADLAEREKSYMDMLARAGQEQADWVQANKAAIADQEATFAERTRDLENEIKLAGLSGAAHARAAMQIAAENLARDKNGKVVASQVGHYMELLEQLERQNTLASILDVDRGGFNDLLRQIEMVGQALREATDPAVIARLEEAMGRLEGSMRSGMIESAKAGLQSLQSMSKEGSKSFAAMQVAIDALNVANAINAVLNQGKGDPYTAFARMAAMAAAVATLVGSIGGNFGGTNGFTDTAEERQETQGTGTVLGDWEAKSESIANATEITADATSKLVGISTGMLRALNALQDAIGAATGILARGSDEGFSDLPAAGSFGDAFLGGALSSLPLDPLNLLGGSSRITDQGILIMGNLLEGIVVGAFQEVQSRRWRFGSRRTSEEVVDVGDELQSQFELIIGSIVDTVREGALALGLLPDEIEAAIAAFEVEEIRISLMDLSAEEQQAELAAVFSAIFDNLAADVVPFIEQFQQVGEGLGETLVRVATSVQVTQEAITQLGLSIGELDPERMAQVSVGLVEAMGGIEQFIQGMQSFVDNFASDSHRFAVAQDAITRAFEQVGLVVPDTREGMWALMQSLDATTESGREQIATLLRLSSTADAYFDHLERGAEAALRAAEAQRAAVTDYAEFAASFAAQSGSPFQNAMRGLREEFDASIERANELARAAGLQGAREEDLARMRAAFHEQEARAIADLTQTIVAQIGELYGTSAEALERRIAGIDEEIAGMDRSDSGFGMIQNLLRESQLQAERAGLVEELQAQREAEEALRRQTTALDLAQNLADLSLARGIDFESLAAELGLDLGRFGADLGMTAEGVTGLIEELKLDALTADVFGEGVEDIVAAILLLRGDTEENPDIFDKPTDPTIKSDAASYEEEQQRRKEELELLRTIRDSVQPIATLPVIAASTERVAVANEQAVVIARQESTRAITGEQRISPNRQPGIHYRPK